MISLGGVYSGWGEECDRNVAAPYGVGEARGVLDTEAHF